LENLDLCLPDKNFSLKDQVRSGNRSGKTWPGLIVGLPIGTPGLDLSHLQMILMFLSSSTYQLDWKSTFRGVSRPIF
jgi:hypothetical protein